MGNELLSKYQKIIYQILGTYILLKYEVNIPKGTMKQCNQQLKSFTQMLRYIESKVPHKDAGNIFLQNVGNHLPRLQRVTTQRTTVLTLYSYNIT
jgi:hypothetical protein